LVRFDSIMNSNKNLGVLWGCSIEPKLLQHNDILSDLNDFKLIIARENMTYNALIEAGITKNTHIIPDPAFILEKVELTLPKGFVNGNTIGINISPLLIVYENDKGLIIEIFQELIHYIIDTTKLNIALIPHVVINGNDDRIPLRNLYNTFKDTGRVVIIDDHNCMELKGFISRCRMFIGARTHATIAAYSSCVPTLVIGYSVKAKGIAKDIFGTYENYVIPVQSLENEDDLINAFEWLKTNEDSIRKHLQEFMPGYCAKAMEAGGEIRKLLENK